MQQTLPTRRYLEELDDTTGSCLLMAFDLAFNCLAIAVCRKTHYACLSGAVRAGLHAVVTSACYDPKQAYNLHSSMCSTLKATSMHGHLHHPWKNAGLCSMQ